MGKITRALKTFWQIPHCPRHFPRFTIFPMLNNTRDARSNSTACVEKAHIDKRNLAGTRSDGHNDVEPRNCADRDRAGKVMSQNNHPSLNAALSTLVHTRNSFETNKKDMRIWSNRDPTATLKRSMKNGRPVTKIVTSRSCT